MKQPQWDKYEAAFLLEYCLKVENNELSRKEAITTVSEHLRERAKDRGFEIDEVFRNENGISMQMSAMRNCYLEKNKGLTISKLFKEVVALYKTNRNIFEKIIQEESSKVNKTIYQEFLLWLKTEKPNDTKEVIEYLSMLSMFVIKRKQLHKPIADITDADEIEHLQSIMNKPETLGIHAEVFDYSKITEKSGVITDYWTNNLLDLILRKDNLNNAYKQVKKNKGKGGIDGMQVDELLFFLRENQDTLIRKIREGKYKPNPVRRVEIPKETKGEFRKLGVPTVVDRVIQQAIAQELSPVYEERFSENSFGFRPKRGAHDALRQCQKNVNDGYVYVVDMDLEKFFDTVCQSKLIEVLSRTIKDKNYAQWYCSGKIGRGELACSDPATVSGVRLNKYLVEMADMLLDYSTIEYSKNLLKRRTLKWLEDLKDQLSTPTNNEAVEKAIADLERKRGNLIDLYTDGLITKTEFKSKSVELDNELEKQKALLDAQEVNPDIKAIEDTIT